MPKIPQILFEDITIKASYTGGHNQNRCINSLWSIHNVIKTIILNEPDNHAKILECLYTIGVNAKFEDDNLTSLVYSGKTNKKYKRNMPSTKYLFMLEKYGFVFYDLITSKQDIPRNKLNAKDIIRFRFTYKEEFQDAIFGLKLFSEICLEQIGDCFYVGDIRVAYENAPKLYAPPIEEVFYFLPEEQQKIAYAIHNKLIQIGCTRNLEREYMTKYMHPKAKGKVFATIYAAEDLYFLSEADKHQKLTFKLNLRNISKYENFLHDCKQSVQQSIVETENCYSCNKKCGGIEFSFKGTYFKKCPFYSFKFYDLSESAIESYVNLIELESNELCKTDAT